jgi:hypothetical protein
MKNKISYFAIAALATLAAVPARATIFDVNFTGVVYQTQGATGDAVGDTVMGHFALDDSTGNFRDFTVAGMTVASGFQSSAAIVPALTDAIYTAQVSPVSTGGTSNSSFSLDLSSLTTFPSTETAFSLLTDATQLTTDLDTLNNPASAFPSTFDYYTANANGTNVVSLNANLTSISTTVLIPEPGSLALVAFTLLGLGVCVRRRRAT